MDVIVRATVVFFFLWAVTRGLGKRELAEMSPFEMILLVVLGDLVQQGITQSDTSVTGALLAVGTIAGWVLLLSYSGWRWPSTRGAIEGLPSVIIRDGHVLEEALRLERLPLDEVMQAARRQGIDDLDTVRVAMLEADGSMSFIL